MSQEGSTDVDGPDEVALGPLVSLMIAMRDGSIGLAAASEAARGYGERGEVSPQQLVGIATASLNRAVQGAWRQALPVAELAYEAARAAQAAHPADPGFTEAWVAVGADIVEVLHAGLLEQGDIRMYLRAVEIARETAEAGALLSSRTLEGLVLVRFGSLVLDAYTAGRTPSNYQGQFDAWVARALQGNDPELKWLLSQPLDESGEPNADEKRPKWPEPLDALDVAEQKLRSALPLVVPERRGSALKALAQTLEWRGVLGGETDEEELRRVARQALEELAADDPARLDVMGMLERLGDGDLSLDDELVHTLEYDWAGFVAEHDEREVWDAVGQASTLLQGDPRRALSLLMQRRGLTSVWADGTLRSRHFETELTLFVRAFSPPGFDAWAEVDRAAEQAVALAAAATSAPAAREASAALVGAMLATTSKDREALGLTLVDELDGLDRTLWVEHEDALNFLVASLLRGEGVNRMRAGEIDEAGSYYRQAADWFRKAKLTVALVECLGYIDDVVRAGTTELDELTAWLAAYSLELEVEAPVAAPPAIHDLTSHVLAAQASKGTSAEVIQLLFQVLNGRRFAAMLANGTEDFRLDDRALYLLGRVAEAEAELPPDSDVFRAAPFDAGLGDDDMVTAWVDEYETGPSETPEDRIANLQRAVEQYLSGALGPQALPHVAPLAELRERLDDRTALLQLFEGPWIDGSLAVWQLLLTRELAEIAVGTDQMPHGLVRAAWRGRTVTLPESGFYVGAVRRELQSDPGPLDVSPEAQSSLAGADKRYLRVVEDHRDRLDAAGVDRLVIAPHGSSRYLPLHLAGPPDSPAADRWTVTYLTNLAQLTVDRDAPQRRAGAAVFALSYADQPQLPRLDDSADEAGAIARECGTTPVLDEGATEEAFRRALESCRYVHLRAHGRLYVDAPSFHTVFLHPSGDDDGRMRAYELLPLNLTGLELVTLGACETALGRVDRFDNPRGLPASLLLAGAQSIVGTLWPVLASASTFFFTELYRELMTGDGDVTSAFAGAQRSTRREFPQYRDWGAFYLVGGVTRRRSG